ncbi:MAG: thiol-disulfide oxidoreductase DCC family protein, partial [Verrucomicrobiia bacterium]
MDVQLLNDVEQEILNSNRLVKNKKIILFDGVCHLCDWVVLFVLERNKKKDIYFTPLQSDQGAKFLDQFEYPNAFDEKIVFIENGRVFDGSTACLKVAKHLSFPWAFLQVFLVIPKVLRDSIYHIIARNRFRWFGKKDICSLPKTEDKHR